MLRSYLEMGEYTFDMAVVFMGVSFCNFTVRPIYDGSRFPIAEICIIRAKPLNYVLCSFVFVGRWLCDPDYLIRRFCCLLVPLFHLMCILNAPRSPRLEISLASECPHTRKSLKTTASQGRNRINCRERRSYNICREAPRCLVRTFWCS